MIMLKKKSGKQQTRCSGIELHVGINSCRWSGYTLKYTLWLSIPYFICVATDGLHGQKIIQSYWGTERGGKKQPK